TPRSRQSRPWSRRKNCNRASKGTAKLAPVLKGRFVKVAASAVSAFAIVLWFCGTQICAQVSSDDAKTVKEFETRVSKYVALRKTEAGSPPRPTNSPEKVAGSQEDAAAKVQAKRHPAPGTSSPLKSRPIFVDRLLPRSQAPRERIFGP